MFKELAKLTEQSIQIKIVMTGVSDGQINLLIEPKPLKEGAKSPITSPLSITATPEELDNELPAYLSQFSDRTVSIFSQFESQMAAFEEEARQNAEKSVAKKASVKPTSTKAAVPAPKVEEKEEEQDMLSLF